MPVLSTPVSLFLAIVATTGIVVVVVVVVVIRETRGTFYAFIIRKFSYYYLVLAHDRDYATNHYMDLVEGGWSKKRITKVHPEFNVQN